MKRTKLTACLSAFAITLSGCAVNEGNNPTEVTKITLDKERLELVKGETFKLSAEVFPENATDFLLKWTSDNSQTATVDQSGLVSAIDKGSADITVSCGDATASCQVTVVGTPVSEIVLNEDILEIRRGDTFQLTATVLPNNADNKEIQWSTSDKSIITVENGLISALKTGNATVTAAAGNKTADCEVTVLPIEVESVTLNETSVQMTPGSQIVLTATVLPEDSDERTVSWLSSDESVLTVENGTVTAISKGEAIVTAKCGGKEATCNITVSVPSVQRGDFYYSDGTWSSELNPTKTPVGIVFWSGDATSFDKTLKEDHPQCTNGLAVSIHEYKLYWQEKYSIYLEQAGQYGGHVGKWVEENASDLMSTISTATLESNLNKPVGYNNTKAIERFNNAPENNGWKVNCVEYITEHQQKCPAPESSSGWYLPSAKELTMFCWGEEYNDNIFYMNIPYISIDEFNQKLEQIQGADRLLYNSYWSSTEIDYSPGSAFYLYFMYSNIRLMPKSMSYNIRYILAF